VYCSLGWLCKVLCVFVEVPWRIQSFTAGGAGVGVSSCAFCCRQKLPFWRLCASPAEWAQASRASNGPLWRLDELYEANCRPACARRLKQLVCGAPRTTALQIGCSTRCIRTSCHLLVPHGAAQITQTPPLQPQAPSLAATPTPKLTNQQGNTPQYSSVKTFGRE
jgi:hypothetical protein